jgi:hypothetical protein
MEFEKIIHEGNIKWRRSLDLSRVSCHVCGWPLHQDCERAKEWCTNRKCFLFAHEFNIPYKYNRMELVPETPDQWMRRLSGEE